MKGLEGRDRGVSECHDAKRSSNSGYDGEASDAGAGVEGTRSVSTPVIPRQSSIMPFSMEEEDSLTLLNYKSYFNQPLARCLDGFVDFNEREEEEVAQQSRKNEDTKKLRDKPDDFGKENKPLRITKRQDRVKTATQAQNETQPTTSAPRPVQRQPRRPSLTHRKSSASIIALENLMHELENFSVSPSLEEQEEIAMEEDKPIIRRDPKEVQEYWSAVRINLWVDEDEVYNPEDYSKSKIATSSDIPKIQLPLPGTTDVSARASCAFDKKIPLPPPPIPFRSPNRVSSAGRASPSSSMGTPSRLVSRSISRNSSSPLKYSLTAGHPPPSPSASVRPEPPTPLSPPNFFRQTPSPPPRSSKRPVSPPLSTTGKDEYLDGDTPKPSPSKKLDLSSLNHEQNQSRSFTSSSFGLNAGTSQTDWDSTYSASEYGDEPVLEQKAEGNHRRRNQPYDPSLDEIDGLFSRALTDSAASSPVTAVDVGGSQVNTPKAESAFDQIKKRIESMEEKKRSAYSRRSSLVLLSDTSESTSLRSQSGSHQETLQKLEQEQHSSQDHPSPTHSKKSNDDRRHSRRRLHLSAMNLPGLRHLRSRQSKSNLSTSDSDSLRTPTTANSISSTRATISSPVPILSAGISNPDDCVLSSIPYSATRPATEASARSSLASIIESSSCRQLDGGPRTSSEDIEGEDTETEATATGRRKEANPTTVVSYPRKFLTKVPKLEEAPKGRDSEDGEGSSSKGFRAHFRRRNKSKDEKMERKEMEGRNEEVQEFLNSHRKNGDSPGKEGATRSKFQNFQNEGGRNDQNQYGSDTATRVGFKEGATGITTSASASSIPRNHHFGRSHSGPGNNGHHLTSHDDTHLPHHPPSRSSTDDHDNTPTQSQIPNAYALTLPIPRRQPARREDHLSKIQKLINSEDSFHTSLRSFQSLRRSTGSNSPLPLGSLHSHSQSMHSIPESNSTGSMYSQDQDSQDQGKDKRREEEEKREDASMLIGEVLETVKSLAEEVRTQEVVKGRTGKRE